MFFFTGRMIGHQKDLEKEQGENYIWSSFQYETT